MTKPTVFNYKAFEDLRQAYKELLSDNQTLMADNRKLRAEVEELKRVNEGYTKVIAKSQDTVNKLMLEIADSPQGKWIPCDGLPKIIGNHVLVTIKWKDNDLEVCEMCPTEASRYNIIAFQDLPEPYKGAEVKSVQITDGGKSE